jgi:acyl-CoA hydrolase
VRAGEIVRLEGRVRATLRRSLEIEVVVQGEDATTGRTWPCMRAMLSFVALDEDRKPTPVPELLLESEDDRRRHREVEERRARRLASPSSRA